MEQTTVIDDAEFSLPPGFLTDDDFLVEKENKVFKGDEYKKHGFASTGKPIRDDEERFVAGMAMKTVQSTSEDDFSGGFHAFSAGSDAKAWGSTTRCGAGNQNCQMQVSSQTVAEELALININGYNNHNGRGLLDLPRKHPLAAAKIPNDGSGYYNRQSLHYQKLRAIQQLKQQQLMKYHRQLSLQSRGLGANNNNKIAGSVDLLPSSWSNQPQRRDVFLQNRTGKHGSTGTGVFLPRCVNHATAEKPMVATVLVPGRVVQPSVRSSPSLNDGLWSNDGGFSSQMKMEQPVKEPRLPLDWAY